VTIGVIDSGIDTSNPEFAGRISSASADIAGSRGLTNGDDDHGSTVAMVAAAARNNVGVMGVAYGATIAAMRIDSPGSCAATDGCSFLDSNIAIGINSAVTAGAKVINLSIGGSTPGNAVKQAIVAAANAGVVVVVSAGNDGAAEPDAFATALRTAGNGNVIIAGSVDKSNVISSFSNKAGLEANYYLAALGENVCCRYANGTIEYTQSGGKTFYTVYSGTSFSAPQISGAIALVRQAFPRLTAAQAVQLLLTSATDAGASGSDATYGAGILNIGAAFNAQGATSFAGTSVQVVANDTSAVTSAAMGDAASGASLRSVVLDAFGRPFAVNLADGLKVSSLAPRLTMALTNRQQTMSLGGGRVAMAFTVDATGRTLALPWSGALRLSGEDAVAARVMAGRVMARISGRTQLGFAFSQSSDGLVASLQGQDRPAFLIAANPLDDTGFVRSAETSLALRHTLGRWGLTLSGQSAKGETGALWRREGTANAREMRDAVQRFGAALDRRFGDIETSLGAQWLGEERGIIGARFNPALGAHGADSVFFDAALGWRPHPDFHFGFGWRQGYTRVRGSSLIGVGSHLISNGWVIDGSIANMFKVDDVLALRLSQPLRVASGGLQFYLPVGYDYDTGAVWATRSLALAPHGRELDAELAWQFPLHGGRASTNLFWRRNPGHFATLPDDTGLSLGWKTGF